MMKENNSHSDADLAGPDRPPATVGLTILVNIRWMAIAGQIVALIYVFFGFGFDFSLFMALGAVGMSAALNLLLINIYRPGTHLSEVQAAAQLTYDLCQLSALLFLTGGISNPFFILMLAPVAISATFLGRRSTLFLLSLGLLLSFLLVSFHAPLPWDEPPLELAERYKWGLWGGLAVSMVFLAFYSARVSEEARRRADALSAAQAALVGEKHLAALGALAAAAAHELGTPLGSIMLTARELEREYGTEGALAEDLSLIAQEAHRCREILKTLSATTSRHQDEPFPRTNIDALVHEAAAPYEGKGVNILFQSGFLDDGSYPVPTTTYRAEIRHGLGNLIENATEFAASEVVIDVAWDADKLIVEIKDDGPGFSAAILARLGQPYLTGGRDVGRASENANERNVGGKRSGGGESGAGGLGLGVFIAKTLIERTGGHVTFANRKAATGAVAKVSWLRSEIPEDARRGRPRRDREAVDEGL